MAHPDFIPPIATTKKLLLMRDKRSDTSYLKGAIWNEYNGYPALLVKEILMKRRSLVALIAVAVFAGGLYAAEEIDLKDIKCVVNAKAPAKADNGVDYKEGKVFFCCQNCPKSFAKDTAKFAAKANKQLVATKQYKEVKCPLSGQDLNPDTAIDVAGVKVAFCCEKCQGKVAKAKGDEQIDLVFSDAAFKKAFEVAKKK